MPRRFISPAVSEDSPLTRHEREFYERYPLIFPCPQQTPLKPLPAELRRLFDVKRIGPSHVAIVPKTTFAAVSDMALRQVLRQMKLAYTQRLDPEDPKTAGEYFKVIGASQKVWEAEQTQRMEALRHEEIEAACRQLRERLTRLRGPRAAAQRKVLEALIHCLEVGLEPFHGRADTDERDHYRMVADEWTRLVFKAIRLGVTDLPLLDEWIAWRQTFGERKVLRRAKAKLERGVKPMPLIRDKRHNVMLNRQQVTAEYQRLAKQGLSVSAIHTYLTNRGLISKRNGQQMSRRGFAKLLQRWGVR